MESQIQEGTKKKVCIIGAGPTGLLATRHLKDIADIQVFEAKNDIGGMWLYTDTSEINLKDLDKDSYYNLYGCLHSSLYKDLTTNIPKIMMVFKDFWMDESVPYIMTHWEYIKYLRDFADKFELRDHIKLNTLVTSVKVDENASHRYWVKYKSWEASESSEETTNYFDYVLVWNGRLSYPNTPEFEGRELFKGSQFHIHNLRDLEHDHFDGKNILIVGGWMSAWDLLDMLLLREDTKSKVSPKKIFITSRNTSFLEYSVPYKEAREQGMLEIKTGNVTQIKESSVVFGDQSEEPIDTIIYATGYKFWYPFFDPNDKIVEFDEGGNWGRYFGPIYKKMFCVNEPGIIFIGLVEKLLSIMSIFERQVLLAKQYILGDLKLPSKEDMLDSLQSELEKNDELGYEKSKFFVFYDKPEGYTALHYSNDLEKMTNMELDSDNYSIVLGKLIPILIKCFKEGNGSQFKGSNFKELLEEIDFKPTSDKF